MLRRSVTQILREFVLECSRGQLSYYLVCSVRANWKGIKGTVILFGKTMKPSEDNPPG